MEEKEFNTWATTIGEIILGFGTVECWTRYLVEISSGDEGYVHQGNSFQGRIDRTISLLTEEPQCALARQYDREKLIRVLQSAKCFIQVRNDIAHNPLVLTSAGLAVYSPVATKSTGDVVYDRTYTLDDLVTEKVKLNILLKEVRQMQEEANNP
ncbi:MAG: hypothetical protein ACOYK4_05585 [Candidatus Planktophila sp.]